MKRHSFVFRAKLGRTELASDKCDGGHKGSDTNLGREGGNGSDIHVRTMYMTIRGEEKMLFALATH